MEPGHLYCICIYIYIREGIPNLIGRHRQKEVRIGYYIYIIKGARRPSEVRAEHIYISC